MAIRTTTRQEEDTSGASAESIGPVLRSRREERDLTIRGLARSSGISASMISQVELGRASPSLSTLLALTSELGVSLDELFFRSPADPVDIDPPRPIGWEPPSEGPVLRSGNRLRLTHLTGVIWERLTPWTHTRLEFLYVTYPAGAQSCPPDDLTDHKGSEYGLLLSGRMGLTVGEESFELDAGDSVAFDATVPHRLWAIGEEPATAIWVVVGRAEDPRLP